jgi:tellurite resistance protein TerC
MGSIGSPMLWGSFTLLVTVLLVLDLGVFHRRAHVIGPREALGWSAFWVTLALGFNGALWLWFGPQRGLEFLTGYLIEKALSIDNIFVFVVLFSYFQVPQTYQHRVLFWGIVGAIIFRMIFILAGAALLEAFHPIVYGFGALLILTGLRLLRAADRPHPDRNPFLRLARRVMPITDGYRDGAFVIREAGRRAATPLLLALIAVETTDIIFAVDSIPAIFAVTRDPFIVYTSNIFAVLGLRALYFLLAGVVDRFHLLKVGLSLVLIFVGLKMLVSDVLAVPIGFSLATVAVMIGGSILASLARPARDPVASSPEAERL